jgi:hypothetical protein
LGAAFALFTTNDVLQVDWMPSTFPTLPVDGAGAPVIAGFPFRMDPDHQFNARIAAHLPPEPRHAND